MEEYIEIKGMTEGRNRNADNIVFLPLSRLILIVWSEYRYDKEYYVCTELTHKDKDGKDNKGEPNGIRINETTYNDLKNLLISDRAKNLYNDLNRDAQ